MPQRKPKVPDDISSITPDKFDMTHYTKNESRVNTLILLLDLVSSPVGPVVFPDDGLCSFTAHLFKHSHKHEDEHHMLVECQKRLNSLRTKYMGIGVKRESVTVDMLDQYMAEVTDSILTVLDSEPGTFGRGDNG